jgi:hypothetical protein
MRVLVVGTGGREHAVCWALAASPLLTKLWCAPGNPGTAALGENVPIGTQDIAALVAFARDHAVDLVVPGPEAPLVAGSRTRSASPASPAAARRRRLRGWREARVSPKRIATPPVSRPRAGNASTTPRRRGTSCAAAARRSW